MPEAKLLSTIRGYVSRDMDGQSARGLQMLYESKSARRDRLRREKEEKFEIERQREAIRRKEHPTLEERVEDIENVLREHFGVILNWY
jgi:hypothetical protein